MSAKTKAGKPAKITIQVWRPIWSKLEKKLEAACLRRDAYIGKLVEKELDYLEEEMPIANSEAAEKFIDSQFRALQDFTPLSIALKPETAARLVQVCSSKRIVRDSFFNRLFLFIAFGPQMAGKLLFLGIDDGIGEVKDLLVTNRLKDVDNPRYTNQAFLSLFNTHVLKYKGEGQ